MGNNDLSNNEEILIKVDQNNLIYVDPNSIVVDGEIEPRNIRPENLMMYVNLEADLVPRSTLISSNDKNTLFSVAKGTLNFLKNQKGGDYDATWTDAFFDKIEVTRETKDLNLNNESEYYQSDGTAQSFGIDSINITTKGFNAIPQVTINFIDVRGKTLFDSPENSPYKAFFHLPWPIFYLTVKGYYGKAVRYRLHLVKFSSRFNESNGNFEVVTNFIGSTYAHLTDIPLNGMLNAPYMFRVESTKDAEFNERTGRYVKKISKSSRGYAILNSVYNEYKQKRLIDQDFPVRTLRELISISETLDVILENEIFNKVDFRLFSGVVEYEKNLSKFGDFLSTWIKKNLTIDNFSGGTNNVDIFYYLKGNDRTDTSKIFGDKKTLEIGLKNYKEILLNSKLFANNLINKTKSNFSTLRSSNRIRDVKDYVGYTSGKLVGINVDLLEDDFKKMVNEFNSQKKTLQTEIEEEINRIIKDPKLGIGFEPTIRNIFAVILANAEVYIRLLKDVHTKAFKDSENRKKILQSFSDETPGGGAIYPWPEVKKSVGGGSKHKVIAYPGDKDLIEKLKSNDKNLWPEVDFVEEYIAIATNKYDPLSDKEGGVGRIDYIFESNLEESNIKKISSFDGLINGFGKSLGFIPYTEKTLSSILYEMFERSFYATTFDTFSTSNPNTILELSDIEFENLQESIKEDYELIDILKDEVRSINDLFKLMKSTSTFDRFPYLVDRLPTVTYLDGILETPFKFEQYYDIDNLPNGAPKPVDNDDSYPELAINLLKYKPENHRLKIYPFNSKTYLSYINKNNFSSDELKFGNVLKVNTSNGFITSEINSELWVKNSFTTNLFSNKFTIIKRNLTGLAGPLVNNINILNTPYFHQQLYSDFNKGNRQEKYVGSSYLLLNSLPFKDLEDVFSDGIRVSSLFREIGSTHFIPYHLLLKWGSIYHRYKRKILDNVDILDGFLTTSNVTKPFNGSVFFDNNSGLTFTLNSTNITYSNNSDIGIHPYYDAIFHQILNGYNHYSVFSGASSFNVNANAGGIRGLEKSEIDGMRFWTTFVDNSKYQSDDQRLTILPSVGFNLDTRPYNFFAREQRYTRIIWEDDTLNYNFSGITFPKHSEYCRTFVSGSTYDNIFGIDNNFRKVLDLIGTFSPKILEDMESMFLEFSKEKIEEEIPYKRFKNVEYYNFQDLLRDICTVKKESSDETNINEQVINEIKTRQSTKLEDITTKILSKENLISFTISNPKEIDPYVYGGFAQLYPNSTFTYRSFDVSQIMSNSRYIDLYLGEDIDNKYLQFFATNDIELSEENVLQFRSLAQIFAGQYINTPTPLKNDFIKYIETDVFRVDKTSTLTDNHTKFLDNLITKLSKLETTAEGPRKLTPTSGFGDEILKLDLYNVFKSFNDKWVGGNSIGQRLLLEEFLFLDKANKDIGSEAYINIQKLTPLDNPKNQKQNLYGVISMLIQGTGFDMRTLPSYVNFYGANYSNKTKPIPSKNLAKNLFGTFLEVDYQESSPKVILQYVGPTSKHLDLNKYSKDYKFMDDGFNIQDPNNNPLIITSPAVFNDPDLYKSNRVVAFEVSFGDQNQGIFKSVQLDQSTLKNTTESFVAMENLGRSESGSNSYQVDIGLFDIYRQSSYACQVSSMGNVMIQPTMYFYLKNIPMFKGTYWITDVTHSIKGNSISTVFNGTRIPYASLPDPKESTMASYKPLFDAILNKALVKTNELETNPSSTERKLKVQDNISLEIDPGSQQVPNEVVVNESGVNIFGVPYNGFSDEKYILLVENSNFTAPDGTNKWFRAQSVEMGGFNYPLSPNMSMGIVSNFKDTNINERLKWSDISKLDSYFYGTRFLLNVATADYIFTSKVTFLNPRNSKSIEIIPDINLNSDPKFVKGPVHVGPSLKSTRSNVTGNKYAVALSSKLMKELSLLDGDVVYFKLY